MSRIATWAAAVLAVTAVGVGCGVSEGSPTFVADEDVPFGLLASTTTTPVTDPGPAPRSVQVCFVRDATVTPVQRQLTAPGLDAAVAALADGPTPAEQAAGLRTALLTEDAARQIGLSAGIARVDLTPGFAAGGTQNSTLALGQLVCTLTAQPGVGQVSFTLEGQPVDVPLADGSLATRPVTRDDYAGIIGPPADPS